MSGYAENPNAPPPPIEFMEPKYPDDMWPGYLAKMIPASNKTAHEDLATLVPAPELPVQVNANMHDPLPGQDPSSVAPPEPPPPDGNPPMTVQPAE